MEIAAIKYCSGEETQAFNRIIKCGHPLKAEIVNLTGITDEYVEENGVDISEALNDFWNFVGKNSLV